MLFDSAHIQEKDAERENKWRARTGKPLITTLYNFADTERTLQKLRPLAYGQQHEVAPGVQATFHDAGHILGSAVVELNFTDHHLQRHLVFSDALDNTCSPLMHEPSILTNASVNLW
ncbi:MAG: metallo-beta-lactamase family protein [Pseudomonas sp.]|jgi:metallo-beta-lactamase family protein